MKPYYKTVLFWVGIAISAVLSYVVISGVDWDKTWRVIKSADGIFLVFLPIVAILSMLVKSLRWRITYPRSLRPTYRDCFSAMMIGNFLNVFVPARLGDIVRCVLVGRNGKPGKTTISLATLFLEKFLDVFALLLVILVYFAFFDPPVWVERLEYVAVSIIALSSLFLFSLIFFKQAVANFLGRLFRFFRMSFLTSKIEDITKSFIVGIEVIGLTFQTAALGITTAAIWLLDAVIIFLLARAIHLDLGIISCLVVSSVIGLGFLVPASPGAVGTYDFFAVSAFKLFGVDTETALALTLLSHALFLLTAMCFGLIGIYIQGGRFTYVMSGSMEKENLVE